MEDQKYHKMKALEEWTKDELQTYCGTFLVPAESVGKLRAAFAGKDGRDLQAAGRDNVELMLRSAGVDEYLIGDAAKKLFSGQHGSASTLPHVLQHRIVCHL